jgi:hypothetical protein
LVIRSKIFIHLLLKGLIFVLILLCIAACNLTGQRSGKPDSTNMPTSTLVYTITPAPTSTLISTSTPVLLSYSPYKPLLAQVIKDGPVYVTGDNTVPFPALTAANTILAAMLQHRPDIVKMLRTNGAFTVVASHNEQICDLIYFSSSDASICALYGMGGAGGVMGSPITACHERNLLKEHDDPYVRGSSSLGQNICVHELAHTIMDVGLSLDDREQIAARFKAAQAEGLWTGDYAMNNDLEFWAVMSQFYFSAGPSTTYASAFSHVANGPVALKKYDPETYSLVDSIYQGSTNLS